MYVMMPTHSFICMKGLSALCVLIVSDVAATAYKYDTEQKNRGTKENLNKLNTPGAEQEGNKLHSFWY